jgi:hypothetical protein
MRSEGVLHGLQLADPDRHMTPLSYYGPETGIAQALKSLKSKSDLRIATVVYLKTASAQKSNPLSVRNVELDAV